MTRPARRRRSTCCWPRPGASPGRSPAREQGSAWPGGTVPLCRRLRPSRSTTPGPSARGPRGRPSGRAQRLHRTSKQASTSPKPPQSGQKNVPEGNPERTGNLPLDLLEAAQPFQVGVLLLRAIDQLAFQVVQGGEQTDRAVQDVVVRSRAHRPHAERQSGLRACASALGIGSSRRSTAPLLFPAGPCIARSRPRTSVRSPCRSTA